MATFLVSPKRCPASHKCLKIQSEMFNVKKLTENLEVNFSLIDHRGLKEFLLLANPIIVFVGHFIF